MIKLQFYDDIFVDFLSLIFPWHRDYWFPIQTWFYETFKKATKNWFQSIKIRPHHNVDWRHSDLTRKCPSSSSSSAMSRALEIYDHQLALKTSLKAASTKCRGPRLSTHRHKWIYFHSSKTPRWSHKPSSCRWFSLVECRGAFQSTLAPWSHTFFGRGRCLRRRAFDWSACALWDRVGRVASWERTFRLGKCRLRG